MLKSVRQETLQMWSQVVRDRIPKQWRETAKLRVLGLFKIPVLFFIGPRVIELEDRRCVIEIPLNRRTRNHYRSMYFGVLAAGADLGAGILAQFHNEQHAQGKVDILFKDFTAKFLKRAEGDTHFVCEEGEKVKEAVELALKSGERQNLPVRVVAITPSVLGQEPVAEFVLTLSLKAKKASKTSS